MTFYTFSGLGFEGLPLTSFFDSFLFFDVPPVLLDKRTPVSIEGLIVYLYATSTGLEGSTF